MRQGSAAATKGRSITGAVGSACAGTRSPTALTGNGHTGEPEQLFHLSWRFLQLISAGPEARLENLIGSVDLFSKYWKGLPLVTNTGADPDGNEHRVWDGCVQHYQTLADHAQGQGMKIALEALGPSLMNANSILFAYSQAQEMAAAVDKESFGVCLDIYNSWQDPALIDSITSDKLFLVQLADWRRPRSLHDRRALGDGTISLLPILRRLVECGYKGDYVLEIFSDSVSDSLWKDASTIIDAIEASTRAFNSHVLQALP